MNLVSPPLVPASPILLVRRQQMHCNIWTTTTTPMVDNTIFLTPTSDSSDNLPAVRDVVKFMTYRDQSIEQSASSVDANVIIAAHEDENEACS